MGQSVADPTTLPQPGKASLRQVRGAGRVATLVEEYVPCQEEKRNISAERMAGPHLTSNAADCLSVSFRSQKESSSMGDAFSLYLEAPSLDLTCRDGIEDIGLYRSRQALISPIQASGENQRDHIFGKPVSPGRESTPRKRKKGFSFQLLLCPFSQFLLIACSQGKRKENHRKSPQSPCQIAALEKPVVAFS